MFPTVITTKVSNPAAQSFLGNLGAVKWERTRTQTHTRSLPQPPLLAMSSLQPARPPSPAPRPALPHSHWEATEKLSSFVFLLSPFHIAAGLGLSPAGSSPAPGQGSAEPRSAAELREKRAARPRFTKLRARSSLQRIIARKLLWSNS